MLDRRKFRRFETEINARVLTLGFVANTDTICLVSDVSQGGAKIIAPIFFQDNQDIRVEIDILGGPIVLEGTVVGCREDYTVKKRFDKTYSVNIKFLKPLDDSDWKNLMALK